MQKYEKYRQKKWDLQDSKNFLALIGKKQNTSYAANGYLYSIKTETVIYHQETDGATNYHKNSKFDEALSRAIKANFASLKEMALSLLAQDMQILALEAKEEVDLLQKEIYECFVEGVESNKNETKT